ncbi:MAG: FG-GAP-like repeat-containing protein [Planctomycetaceae bacterium]
MASKHAEWISRTPFRPCGIFFSFRCIGVAICLSLAGCRDASTTVVNSPPAPVSPTVADVTGVDVSTSEFLARLRPQVEHFCGDCHATPKPESFVKQDWPGEVGLGYMFYSLSGRSDLKVPRQDEVTRYFSEQAPEQLLMPVGIAGNPPAKVHFEPVPTARDSRSPGASQAPCIGHLRWADLGLGTGSCLVYSDLGTGTVNAYWPGGKSPVHQRLATLFQPVHAEACDLDQDGNTDLVVADLGEFLAADSDLGRVVWLRRMAGSDVFETIVLQEGLGRVADVQPGDVDGDGDTDLLVAEFGWRRTGRIFWLENRDPSAGAQASFERHEIDPRHGAIHVPTVDLNGDGRLDFIALISQEFEAIEAFINDGQGGFKPQRIWEAADPTYGSSGIQLADIDGDDDIDVVYCNGDSFDHGPKPYHSVQWLENRGEFPFVHHPLSKMPGVLAVGTGDYDGDNDVDLVATSMLPPTIDKNWANTAIESLVLFEQVSPRVFQRTWIETGQSHHGAIESHDFDADGRTDLAVGNFFRMKETGKPDFTIWWNRGSRK